MSESHDGLKIVGGGLFVVVTVLYVIFGPSREDRIAEIVGKTGCTVREEFHRGCTQIDVSGGGRYRDNAWLCCDESPDGGL